MKKGALPYPPLAGLQQRYTRQEETALALVGADIREHAANQVAQRACALALAGQTHSAAWHSDQCNVASSPRDLENPAGLLCPFPLTQRKPHQPNSTWRDAFLAFFTNLINLWILARSILRR